LLMTAATVFVAHQVKGSKASGAEEPAMEQGLGREPASFLGQGDENALGDLLCCLGIAELAECRMVNHAGIAVHQGAESVVRVPSNVFVEQLPVIHSCKVLHC